MEISAVKLRNSYQIHFVDTNNLFVKQNTSCIVETEHGIDVGSVVKCRRYQNTPGTEVKGRLLRVMSEKDQSRIPEIEAIERDAFAKCNEKARAKNLGMKLVSVKCLFDKTKIIFYFVAENRIDFRELVRELASIFRTRIEMRQIGVRDEARLIGGYGTCGKQLCCAHLREDFDPVSIKMAKEQNLNLNSLKISGMCGRLLCCLSYEYGLYKELNEHLPRQGTELRGPERNYTVWSSDALKELIQVRDGDRIVSIGKADVEFRGNAYYLKPEAIKKITQPEEEPAAEDAAD